MNAQTKSINPFKQADAPQNAIAEAIHGREIQEVQAAMIIAKKYPRNQMQAMDNILQACARQSLAEGALYSYSRGGTDISAPSIRLAEVAAQLWGNMQCGVRELSTEHGSSTMEAYAWDLETNTRINKVFQVQHTRYSRSGGNKTLTDPRDIYENNANMGARRLRACILAIIPGDVIEAAANQCAVTLSANVDMTAEGIGKMIVAFEEFGVSKQMIETRIQRRMDAIKPGHVVQLKKIYASLRDEMSTASDWFDIDPKDRDAQEADKPNTGAKAIASKLKKPGRKKKDLTDAKPEEPKVEEKPQPQDNAITTQGEEITYAYIANQIDNSVDLDELALAEDLINTMPAEFKVELIELVIRRKGKINNMKSGQ